MIKYRLEIAAYTFRKYTRHIRQLLSHPSNDNKSSYQENMLLCQRVLVAGFLTWVITSHICEIFGCTEIVLDFHWLVTALIRFPSSPPPPPRFWSWGNWLHVLPNYMYTLIWSGKGPKGNREYAFLDSPLKEITSYKIVISSACSLVSARLNFCASSQR